MCDTKHPVSSILTHTNCLLSLIIMIKRLFYSDSVLNFHIMTTKPRFCFPLLFAVLLFTGNCDTLEIFGGGPVCTLMGCSDGVTVILLGELPESYSITLEAHGMEPQQIEIETGELFSGRHFFGEITSEQIHVTIDTGEKIISQSFEPDFSKYRPNGHRCPPTCLQADLEFYLE